MIDGAIGCRASTLESSRLRLVPQIVTYCCPKSYQTMAYGYLKFLAYSNTVRGPPAKPPEMPGWKNDARQTKYRRGRYFSKSGPRNVYSNWEVLSIPSQVIPSKMRAIFLSCMSFSLSDPRPNHWRLSCWRSLVAVGLSKKPIRK